MRWERQLDTGSCPGNAFGFYSQRSTPHNSPNLPFQFFLPPFLNQSSAPHLFIFPFALLGLLPGMALATSDPQEGPALL